MKKYIAILLIWCDSGLRPLYHKLLHSMYNK